MMETRKLRANRISDANIAGYGRWISMEQQEPAAELPEFSFWNKLGILNHHSTSIGLVHAKEQSEMVSSIFEQHGATTEMLIPADGEVVLVLARSKKGQPEQIDLDTVNAFTLPAGEAIILDRGTWHFAPLALNGSAKIWVIFEEDTPDNDLLMCRIDEQNGLRFVVE